MKLFVGNLPYSATEADITDFFTQAGVTVDSVNVMRDRFTGQARGFGFVEINDDAAAQRAVELDPQNAQAKRQLDQLKDAK